MLHPKRCSELLSQHGSILDVLLQDSHVLKSSRPHLGSNYRIIIIGVFTLSPPFGGFMGKSIQFIENQGESRRRGFCNTSRVFVIHRTLS